ncbi:helix-turn-helix domain-containing protein [Pantoea sp. AS142]|uniref:helix-turn-helix domain-containing protein n=1 Tax=Pantoea sp. AS142 TaxID=3081292 RepID=UPI0030179804
MKLASSVGMSLSSLHYHFNAVMAMTPMQYQKQLPLNEARRLMMVEKLDTGSAGYRVGGLDRSRVQSGVSPPGWAISSQGESLAGGEPGYIAPTAKLIKGF